MRTDQFRQAYDETQRTGRTVYVFTTPAGTFYRYSAPVAQRECAGEYTVVRRDGTVTRYRQYGHWPDAPWIIDRLDPANL